MLEKMMREVPIPALMFFGLGFEAGWGRIAMSEIGYLGELEHSKQNKHRAEFYETA